MPRINYRSDFDFLLTLLDARGTDIGFPPFDFTVTLTTATTGSVSGRRFVASCIGGVATNCFNDGGRLHIVADRHGLPPGRLHAAVELLTPEPTFPDGTRCTLVPAPLDIELTLSRSDLPTSIDTTLILPLVKGDPFTYADFTPEQLAEHRRPATDAAAECRATVSEAVAECRTTVSEAVTAMHAVTTQTVDTLNATNTRVVEAETLREASTAARLAEIDRLTANNGALIRGEKGEKGENAAPIVLSQQEYNQLTSAQRRGNIYYIW